LKLIGNLNRRSATETTMRLFPALKRRARIKSRSATEEVVAPISQRP
jgi:hypothetical protein